MIALTKVEEWDVEMAVWRTSQEVFIIIIVSSPLSSSSFIRGCCSFKLLILIPGARDSQVLFWIHICSKNCSMSILVNATVGVQIQTQTKIQIQTQKTHVKFKLLFWDWIHFTQRAAVYILPRNCKW